MQRHARGTRNGVLQYMFFDIVCCASVRNAGVRAFIVFTSDEVCAHSKHFHAFSHAYAICHPTHVQGLSSPMNNRL